MSPKNLLRAVLLLFVGAAAVVLVGRELRGPSAAVEQGASDELPADGMVVYYFHGDTRCPTCRSIESFAHEAVEKNFGEELAQEKILWRVVNYEQPSGEHYVTDYEIFAPTVVLVRTQQGQSVAWQNLDRVWELVADRAAFDTYVVAEIRRLLAAPPESDTNPLD